MCPREDRGVRSVDVTHNGSVYVKGLCDLLKYVSVVRDVLESKWVVISLASRLRFVTSVDETKVRHEFPSLYSSFRALVSTHRATRPASSGALETEPFYNAISDVHSHVTAHSAASSREGTNV